MGNPNVLINLVSRRVRQLNSGGNRPLIMETAGLSTADIALTEIIEGKMSWESDLPTPKKKTAAAPARPNCEFADLPSARGQRPWLFF